MNGLFKTLKCIDQYNEMYSREAFKYRMSEQGQRELKELDKQYENFYLFNTLGFTFGTAGVVYCFTSTFATSISPVLIPSACAVASIFCFGKGLYHNSNIERLEANMDKQITFKLEAVILE